MLFLYALLFFALGTSVAAIPAVLTTPPPHVSRRGLLDKLKPTINVAERMVGVWICVSEFSFYNLPLLRISRIERQQTRILQSCFENRQGGYCGDLAAGGGTGYPYHAVDYRVVTGDNERY